MLLPQCGGGDIIGGPNDGLLRRKSPQSSEKASQKWRKEGEITFLPKKKRERRKYLQEKRR